MAQDALGRLMRLPQGLGHLSYCTNIHAGESLSEVTANLERYLPPIKARLAPDRPFGVGLRLGHAAAQALQAPGALARLKRFLDEGGFYVFTINGFPYGPFHGRAVKEQVYRPDWSEPERLAYTNALGDILAELLPEGEEGSLSTVPCTFKPWAAMRMEAIVEQLVRHAAHLVRIEQRSGARIVLALEPEPCCYLETIEEAVTFFNEHLHARAAVQRLASLAQLSPAAAEAALRRHIGLCYDVCHAAVEFEDPQASLERLRTNGIRVAKLQLSSALRVPSLDAAAAGHLEAFAEPVYLHQVVQRRNGELRRFADLPEALAQAAGAQGAEWRVHFHVPVFLAEMQHFGTTQDFLARVLDVQRAAPVTAHMEVETYTWDVLPEQYRAAELGEAITRELAWVRARLGA